MGDDFGAVVDTNGNLFVWGSIATGVAAGELQQIEPSEAWADVSVSRTPAASAHVLAIRNDGTLWAFGSNTRGQLGDGSMIDQALPVQISTATDWVEIAAGEFHSMARKSNGLVFLWGGNSYGQLGFGPVFNDPDLDIQTSIGAPLDGDTYIAISAGKAHSHAIRADGTLWAWGVGGYSGNVGTGPELGILIDGHYPVGPVGPTQVGTDDGWTDLFGGYQATFALRDSATQTGQLWVWGVGANLGTGDSVEKVPVRVGTDDGWVDVSVSSVLNAGHALGLKADGTLYGWGINYPNGQLGLPLYEDGEFISENVVKDFPTRLEDPDTFLAIGAGDGFSAVLRADGFLLTAGKNDAGQLANGQTDDSEPGQDFFFNSNLGVADLVAISVTVNEVPEAVGAGETISVSFEVQNAGTGPITDTFEIQAWLNTSPDVGGLALDFDTDAGVETSLEITDDFSAGQSRSLQFDVELPTNIPQGSYYIVVDADTGPTQPVGAIEENDDTNNDAATETTFDFLPDLVVPAAPNGLTVINPPGDGTYDPDTSDTIDIELLIENIGNGTLPSGSSFDVRIFLSPDRSTDNSAIVELNVEEPVILAADLESGATLATALLFSYDVPRMPAGFFFVAVELDINNEIAEQPEILDANDIVVQPDGEANNAAYTDALIEVSGLTIIEAIDQDGVAPGTDLLFSTDGDGNWFGQSFIFNADGDSVQSPSLAAGESAAFSTSFNDYFGPTPTPVAISFDWSSETSSADNRLFFRVINGATGGNNNEISGNTNGWVEDITRVIPVNGRAEWVYEQGVEGLGDAVYVDDLQVTEIDQPDLVIDDIYLPADSTGSYVLQRDSLDITVNSRNQGTDTSVAEDYVISIYLSPDPIFDRPDGNPLTPDDILVRQLQVTEQIFSGDPAVNGLSITLDTDINPGLYYVIGYIDDYTDENGDPLVGATQPSPISVEGEFVGYVDEFTDPVGTSGLFPGEDNNLFITGGAIVEIVALPDLQTSGLTAVPDYYLINDPATNYVEPNSLPLNFTLTNQGLGAVNEPIQVAALFSRDQNIEPDADYVLLDFNYGGNFGSINDAPANTRFVNPDEVDFRENLVTEGYIGERLFLGVFADSTDLITEFSETNNSFYLFSNDFILSELELGDGLDLDPALWDVASPDVVIINDEVAPYDSDNVPWVGQTTETFDNVDAVTSVRIGNNETSKFSVEINPTNGVRVSFWWKVSSQNELSAGITQRDVLRFEVDGAVEAPDIFGTDDPSWQRVEVKLDAGAHTLTWSYIKDDEGSAGEDRGWVDNLTITELPNLTATGISVDGDPSYAAGDTIDTWSFDIVNNGDTIEPGAAFDVEVRLLPNNQWAETDSVVLLTITDTAGIAAGATRTYDQDSVGYLANPLDSLGGLTLPLVTYEEEFYYFGAYVDWSIGDPANGQISESNENENDNSLLTDDPSIQIGLPDLTGDSSSIAGLDPSYAFGDSVDIDLTFTNSGDGSLAAGSDFDYTVYIAHTNDDLLLNTASVVVLGTGTATVAADVASGADLDPANLVAALPFGLAEGDYYLGVKIDVNNEVEEQGLRPDGTGEDGEGNNLFFSQIAVFQVTGISLQIALDDGTSPIALGTFENVLDSDAFWFGRDDSGDTPVDDDQIFEQGEGAQSPALNQGDEASFRLLVPVSSVVKFDWGIFSGSDLNVLSVLVNGVVVDSIAGNEPLAEVDPGILVPDNGIVEWRYSQGAATLGDFAVVDNVRVETNSKPDLVVSAINYTPGEYILDVAGYVDAPNQLVGTEYLDITVEAKNQGMGLVATSFTSADLEVRLSISGEWGHQDNIVLGMVSQVEGDLDSGNLMRFIGPIQLGDSIPEDTYYLMAKVDSNDSVDEYAEANNIMISENRDVEVTRLPALRIYNPDASVATEWGDGINNYLDPREVGGVAFDLDEDLFYYTESPMRLRFSVQNVGLDRVEGSEIWTTQVSLRGALRTDMNDAVTTQDMIDAFTISIELGDFTIQELMEGRSEAKPDGDILDLDLDLALPSGARLNTIIDEDKTIESYLWIIEVTLDSTDVVRESSIIREAPAFVGPSGLPWWIFNIGEAFTADLFETNTDMDEGAFGISFQPALMDALEWELLYPGFPTSDPDNLLAYAFNRNPADGDTAGGQFPGVYKGTTEILGVDYFRLTFDFVTRSSDLVYYVEAAGDLGFSSPVTLAEIKGPYDQLTGVASLTGNGGLIDDPEVTAVLDEGYTARVTVRDVDPLGAHLARFFRVRVESLLSGLPPTGDFDNDGVDNLTESLAGSNPRLSSDLPSAVAQYVAEQLVALGVVVANSTGSTEDYDLDGVSNIAELLYLTDPTLIGSVPSITATDEFVAEEMAVLGVFGAVAVDFAPSDDFDLDGVSNLVELQYGTDPTDQGSLPNPAVDEVDIFVAEQMAAVGARGIGAASVNPDTDYDSDGYSNLVELQYGSNPHSASAGDVPVMSSIEVFVAEEMAAAGALGVGLANIGPNDDYDLDTVSNLAEIYAGTDPTTAPVAVVTVVDYVTAEMAVLGATTGAIAPSADFDHDGVSNLVELQYGTDPTLQASVPVVDAVDIFVAEQMADAGALGIGAASVAPSFDYDSDGYSNLIELLDGTNPNDNTDSPTLSPLEVMVAEEMADSGALGVGIANIGPSDDYDADTVSNLAEIYAGTDPTTGPVAAVTVVDYVTAEMAALGATTGAIAPSADFDHDGVSNLVELQYGTDPTIQGDQPTVDAVDIFVAEQMADAGALGIGAASVAPAFDYDSDGYSNLVELLDGTNPNDNADAPTLSLLEVMVAEEMAEFGALGVGIANIGPNDDYDADGADNLTEIYRSTDPTDVAVVPAGVATYVDIQMTALGATSGLVEANDDFDGDGVSNLVELQYGNSPIDDTDTPTVDGVEVFVAEQMAAFVEAIAPIDLGAVDTPVDPVTPTFTAAVNATPLDDYDLDGASNLIELLYGTDPTNGADTPTLSALEIGVAEEMAEFGALGFGISNIGPFDNYDGDGDDNVTEIFILGTDPTQP
jgi:alpha-tubulin suppressor-like RCC1 family protein